MKLVYLINIFQTGFMFNALITRLSKDPIPHDIVFVAPLFILSVIGSIIILVEEA